MLAKPIFTQGRRAITAIYDKVMCEIRIFGIHATAAKCLPANTMDIFKIQTCKRTAVVESFFGNSCKAFRKYDMAKVDTI